MRFAKQSKGKKNIAVLLVVAMLLTIMPVAAFAVDETEGTDSAVAKVVFNLSEVPEGGFSVEAGTSFDVVANVTTDSAIKVQWKIDETAEEAITLEMNTKTVARENISFTEAGEYTITATFLDADGNVAVDENEKACAVSATFTVKAVETQPTKVIAVDAAAETVVGETYTTIQDAINYIAEQEDPTGWTINVAAGEYGRFFVLSKVETLTINCEEKVYINTLDGSVSPAKPPTEFGDTQGIAIYGKDCTINNMNIVSKGMNTSWLSSAVFEWSYSKEKGLSLYNCNFQGTGTDHNGLFVMNGTNSYTVEDCIFNNYEKAIDMQWDGGVVDNVNIKGNKFINCSFATHGYFGGGSEGKTLVFQENEVSGSDGLRSKVVLMDQHNGGALKVDISKNEFDNALVALMNLQKEGDVVNEVLTNNTMINNCCYIEALEPEDNITIYQAPQGETGKWVLNDIGDFNDAELAIIQAAIQKANEVGSNQLTFNVGNDQSLVQTFTNCKDGIYWVTEPSDIKEPGKPEPPKPIIDKTATNLDKNDKTTVTLEVGGGEEKEKVAVLFVLDKSTSVDVRKAAADMLEELATKTNTNIKYGVVNFWKNAEVKDDKWHDLNADVDVDSVFEKPEQSGTNMHAGLLKAEEMLQSPEIEGYTTYLVTIGDGITYLWTDETTGATQSVYVQHPRAGEQGNIQNGSDVYTMKYDAGVAIPAYDFYLLASGAPTTVKKYENTEQYFQAYDEADEAIYVPLNSQPDLMNYTLIGNEIAVYKTATEYMELRKLADYSYAYKMDKGNWERYPYGIQLMDYLTKCSYSGGEITADTAEKTFENIADQILYSIQRGTVTDEIYRDFDLEDVNTLNLTVGGVAQEKQVKDNVVYFGKAKDNVYPYVVTYTKEAKDANGITKETLVWDINVPVERDKKLALSYELKLVNKSTVEGKHEVPTNAWAELEYTPTDGEEDTIKFPVPEVDYKIPTGGGGTITPNPDPEPPTTNPEKPPVEIPDPDVPLVEPEDPTTEIDEPDVPLIDVPGTPVEEIDEPEVPLGDAPKTGDAAPIVGLVGLLVAAVAGLVVVRRKFN